MSKKVNRFRRLEYFPLLRVFKKPKIELKRFACLEVEGHKVKVKITEEKKEYVICPKCQWKNLKNSLYCLHCSYIFETVATEDKEVQISPWEIKCLGCGRTANRNQKYCLYCGWRIAPFEKEELGVESETLRQKEDPLKTGEVITITIDGKTYHSTDRIIPPDVRELMLKIKKEGYSQELVNAWVKKKNLEREKLQKERYENLQQRIEGLKSDIFLRAGLAVGIVIIIYILRSCLFRL